MRIFIGLKKVWILSPFFVSLAMAAKYPAGMVELFTHQQNVKAGKTLYMRHCSGCHGIDAKGAGPAAQFLYPKPRNIVEGVFKFKSTQYGTLPSKADLLRILERGLPGSSMPSFRLLPSVQRDAIASYVMSLREGWRDQSTDIVVVPLPPLELKKKETFLQSALRGKAQFMELCSSCHGDTGLGNGPAAEGIVDAENQPLAPANLRRKHLKSGSGARDIFRVVSAGIEGAQMPPYGDALSVAARWDIAAYVLFLRGQEENFYPNDFSLENAVGKTVEKAVKK